MNNEDRKTISTIKYLQEMDKSWEYNEYMRGMYNGIECLAACLEKREPVYKLGMTEEEKRDNNG